MANAMLCMKEMREAILVAKRRHSRRISKRNGLVTTMRGAARNALVRRRASDPLRPLVTPYQWLSQVAEGATNRQERRKWAELQERYQVCGPLRPTVGMPNIPHLLGLFSGCPKKKSEASAEICLPLRPSRSCDSVGSVWLELVLGCAHRHLSRFATYS
jgi:hypothetical protein